jgi:hypothetical protein
MPVHSSPIPRPYRIFLPRPAKSKLDWQYMLEPFLYRWLTQAGEVSVECQRRQTGTSFRVELRWFYNQTGDQRKRLGVFR